MNFMYETIMIFDICVKSTILHDKKVDLSKARYNICVQIPNGGSVCAFPC